MLLGGLSLLEEGSSAEQKLLLMCSALSGTHALRSFGSRLFAEAGRKQRKSTEAQPRVCLLKTPSNLLSCVFPDFNESFSFVFGCCFLITPP